MEATRVENTLAYAAMFLFDEGSDTDFVMNGKLYRYIVTAYDESKNGVDTLVVVYNYGETRHEVLNVSTETGNEEITILNV